MAATLVLFALLAIFVIADIVLDAIQSFVEKYTPTEVSR